MVCWYVFFLHEITIYNLYNAFSSAFPMGFRFKLPWLFDRQASPKPKPKPKPKAKVKVLPKRQTFRSQAQVQKRGEPENPRNHAGFCRGKIIEQLGKLGGFMAINCSMYVRFSL